MHNESLWCIPSHQMKLAVIPTGVPALLHSLPLKLYLHWPSLVCPPAFYTCLAIFVSLSPSYDIDVAQIGSSSSSSLSPSLSLGNADAISFLCDVISCISGYIFWSLGPGCIIVFLFQQFFLHLRLRASGVVSTLLFHHSYDSPLYIYFGFNTPSYT